MAKLKAQLAAIAVKLKINRHRYNRAIRRFKANRKRAYVAHNHQVRREEKARAVRPTQPRRANKLDQEAARYRRVAYNNHKRARHYLAASEDFGHRIKVLNEKRRQREAELKRLEEQGPLVMYDSVTVSEIPADAEYAAGYTGGKWPTYVNGELKARCPHARLLSIAVASYEDAECLDIEPGNAPAYKAPEWVKRQKARGVQKPVVYASASQMEEVITILSKAGISRNEVRIWTAHYAGYKHLCGPSTCRYISTEADGTQWTDTSHGRNLDESVLKPGFFA